MAVPYSLLVVTPAPPVTTRHVQAPGAVPAVRDVLDPADPVSASFRRAVSARVAAFVQRQAPVLEPMGVELAAVRTMAAELLDGGKRLRPAFAAWGFVAAAGRPAEDGLGALLDAAASFDLLHASALVHDDVMDSSDVRRGRPAAHRRFEALHDEAGWLGDGPGFGRAGAILLGDLLIMWSAQLLGEAGLADDARRRAQPLVDRMRTEVTCGQYLDMLVQAQPLTRWLPEVDGRVDLRVALADVDRVTEHKSARYTVVRPLQAGAAIGGADDRLLERLAAYGSPLGRAFQLRDDLLGVFGDPAVTGKPAGDDLREGKRTAIVAHAYARTDDAGRGLLVALLGDPDLGPDGVARLQELVQSSGAAAEVEATIEAAYEESLAALETAEVTDEGREALRALADAAVRRAF
ncbi:geranylgeranyl diphosphate synthase, type I [Microlunatus sagamiharensis]|uniref:Geranylgeranyl diphosphate synthase, type I n=1 Tax=Microlunatus sagamiharensis TaxID=546874 RepID=A0A1H2MPX9_9ACTN|nr:geranylgeranyl diphosphate synthase, type I [Microlunatus sagamiharensis]